MLSTVEGLESTSLWNSGFLQRLKIAFTGLDFSPSPLNFCKGKKKMHLALNKEKCLFATMDSEY